MLADLTGKVAFITGAAQGIGRGIALAMAEQGADIAVADIDLDTASIAVKEIEALGQRAIAVETDVTSDSIVQAAVSRAIEVLGPIDILVNNAGMPYFGDDAVEEWEKLFAVNVFGVVRCTNAVLPAMRERRYGNIINIGSMAGHAGRGMGGAYSASKATVLRYTKGLAGDLASENINVNAICPGAVWTKLQHRLNDMTSASDPGRLEREAYEQFLKRYEKVIPMGRPQTAEDVGKMAAFLASDDASNITGQCHHVDGGAIIRD
jgi:NAD(P)-dependent dehydrogenase (short-subunit alcohol dehydrogenase family)